MNTFLRFIITLALLFFGFGITTSFAFSEEDLLRLKKHNSCPGCDLRGANLNWQDLHGVNLENADLRKTQFVAANLRDANLHRANMRGVVGEYLR